MRISAGDALIRFNQCRYTFHDHNYSILVKQIIVACTADALGADAFLTCIEGKLCISKAHFIMSHGFESLCQVVRDWYCLATRVVLHFPQKTICYVCKKELSLPDIRTVSHQGWTPLPLLHFFLSIPYAWSKDQQSACGMIQYSSAICACAWGIHRLFRNYSLWFVWPIIPEYLAQAYGHSEGN